MGCSDRMRMARLTVDTRLMVAPSAPAGCFEGMMKPNAVLIQAMLSPVMQILKSMRA